MKIYEIFIESYKLPFRRYKLFFISFLLAIVFEYVTHIVSYSEFRELSLIVAIIYTIISLVIFGIILEISVVAILEEKFELDFKAHIIELLKEYLITLYYLTITFFVSSFFLIHLSFADDFVRIPRLLLQKNFTESVLTFNELVHQLPLSMQVDLLHNLQLNILVILLVLIFVSSLGFIGKIVAIRSDNFFDPFDLRVIFSIIKKIGYLRYLKFLFSIIVTAIILVNIILILEYFLADILISAFLEVFLIFFISNLFYLIIDDSID